jgi:hypothetical protein
MSCLVYVQECRLYDPFSSTCDQAAANGHTGQVVPSAPRLRYRTPAVSAHANENVCIKNVLFSEEKFQLQDICFTIVSATEFPNLQIQCI